VAGIAQSRKNLRSPRIVMVPGWRIEHMKCRCIQTCRTDEKSDPEVIGDPMVYDVRKQRLVVHDPFQSLAESTQYCPAMLYRID
jgi:hypothetical protein